MSWIYKTQPFSKDHHKLLIVLPIDYTINHKEGKSLIYHSLFTQHFRLSLINLNYTKKCNLKYFSRFFYKKEDKKEEKKTE
jgi:hypothetical protein